MCISYVIFSSFSPSFFALLTESLMRFPFYKLNHILIAGTVSLIGCWDRFSILFFIKFPRYLIGLNYWLYPKHIICVCVVFLLFHAVIIDFRHMANVCFGYIFFCFFVCILWLTHGFHFFSSFISVNSLSFK